MARIEALFYSLFLEKIINKPFKKLVMGGERVKLKGIVEIALCLFLFKMTRNEGPF